MDLELELEQRIRDAATCDEANVDRAFENLDAFVERIERARGAEGVDLIQRVTTRVAGEADNLAAAPREARDARPAPSALLRHLATERAAAAAA
jgi:hypothetical protein